MSIQSESSRVDDFDWGNNHWARPSGQANLTPSAPNSRRQSAHSSGVDGICLLERAPTRLVRPSQTTPPGRAGLYCTAGQWCVWVFVATTCHSAIAHSMATSSCCRRPLVSQLWSVRAGPMRTHALTNPERAPDANNCANCFVASRNWLRERERERNRGRKWAQHRQPKPF